MKKLLASTLLAAGLCGFTTSAEAAECGEVSIAEMNWGSAGVASAIDWVEITAVLRPCSSAYSSKV